MSEKDAIEGFLRGFKQKLKIFDIYFRDDRGKNTQTLADLEITPYARKKIIEELKLKDYYQGPLENTLNRGTDLWVFGKEVKGKEVYIKITLGSENDRVICISFHISEHPLVYPYKN